MRDYTLALALTLLGALSSASGLAEVKNSTDSLSCPPGHFYLGAPENECKNCSYLDQLLSSNFDWVRREVGEAQAYSAEEQQAPKFSLNKPASRVPSSGRLGETSGDVLSRLISAGPHDDELEESSGLQPDTWPVDSDAELDESGAQPGSSSPDVRPFVQQVAYSELMDTRLPEAIHKCRSLKDSTSCQLWSNLCVLSMYSHSDMKQQSSSQRNSQAGRSQATRWQDCAQYSSSSVCDSLRDWHRQEKRLNDDVSSIFADDEALTKLSPAPVYRLGQSLQLIAYRYALDGQLLSVDQFDLNSMKRFCPDASTSRKLSDAEIRLGANMELKCRVSALDAHLGAIQSTKETTFLDLFIGYSSVGATIIKPVPILIKNLLFNGVQSNRRYSRDPSRWKLVRRFFFHTSLRGETQSRLDGQTGHETIVFTKSSTLEFRFRRQERGIALSSILLMLDYSVLYRTGITTDEPLTADMNLSSQTRSASQQEWLVETSSSVSHILVDMLSHRKDLDLIITILSLLSCIWSLIRCYNIQKSSGLMRLDIVALVRFILISCNTLAVLFFVVANSYTGYIFLTYKFSIFGQNLSPTKELDDALITYLILAFCFKLAGLLHDLRIKLNADIFFIDWEKPKVLTSGQIINYQLSSQQVPAARSKDAQSLSETSTLKRLTQPGQSLDQNISFWRPYTVINRWIEMQTLRRLNLTLHLFLFVCIVETSKLIAFSNQYPGVSGYWSSRSNQIKSLAAHEDPLMNSKMSLAFRALILTLIYLILACCQVLYKKYLYEPLIQDAIYEFVDLCSVANVSLFSMMFPRYGYYVHGRNANGSSDCGLSEINALLEREERDLCSMRGLESNSDQQTFVLVLPRIINDHYRRLLMRDDSSVGGSSSWHNNQYHEQHLSQDNDLNKTSSPATSMFRSVLTFSPTQSTSSFGSRRSLVETRLAKCRAINLFLTNFLDHNYKDIDYVIRDKRKFENFLLDTDYDEDRALNQNSGTLGRLSLENRQNIAIFYTDKSASFTSLILVGIEWDLIFLELLELLVIDQWTCDTQPFIITATTVWLLNLIFKYAFRRIATRNLISKALLDEKFVR